MTDDHPLYFVPLGGAGEIGMNVNLYGLDQRWLMVDLGITFADDRIPGVEIILPDIGFIEQEKGKLDGLVLTHAHEDHIGAVPYLWERLRCPIWCVPFTAAVLRRKLEESTIRQRVPINVVEPGETFRVGPFACRFVHMTHSIPEASMLVLETPYGRILHTGDWKLDPAPQLGEAGQIEALQELGQTGGVLAMVADSTNITNPGTSGSEAEVLEALTKVIADQPNRVVLTTFASNVARLQTAMHAATKAGRRVALIGRSMRRMVAAAKDCGYLRDMPPLLDERDVMHLPRREVLLLCTGSQAEPRAALARIASGAHPRISLDPGDTAIFSSKIIPGNERIIYDLHNNLVKQGVTVITEDDHFVHVSGHPSRDEVAQLYRWVKPATVIPVHGELRHLKEHVAFATSHGAKHALLVTDGDLVRLAPGEPEIIGEVPVGRHAYEDGHFLAVDAERYRQRRKLANNGTLFVSLVLDSYGSVLAPPKVTSVGSVELEDRSETLQDLADALVDEMERLGDREIEDDARVEERVRTTIRRHLALSRDRRPVIQVQIVRLSPEMLAQLEDAAT
ncbi:MAG: ribonuclease J [Pseudomonadota bacterium]